METDSGQLAAYVLIGVVVLVMVLYVHFLPAIFAYKHKHPSRTTILILNIFFG